MSNLAGVEYPGRVKDLLYTPQQFQMPLRKDPGQVLLLDPSYAVFPGEDSSECVDCIDNGGIHFRQLFLPDVVGEVPLQNVDVHVAVPGVSEADDVDATLFPHGGEPADEFGNGHAGDHHVLLAHVPVLGLHRLPDDSPRLPELFLRRPAVGDENVLCPPVEAEFADPFVGLLDRLLAVAVDFDEEVCPGVGEGDVPVQEGPACRQGPPGP